MHEIAPEHIRKKTMRAELEGELHKIRAESIELCRLSFAFRKSSKGLRSGQEYWKL